MLTAVERHVLQEMGQTTLALFFLDGTHFLCDVEVGTMLRPVVVADEIGKAIAELAYSKAVSTGTVNDSIWANAVDADRSMSKPINSFWLS